MRTVIFTSYEGDDETRILTCTQGVTGFLILCCRQDGLSCDNLAHLNVFITVNKYLVPGIRENAAFMPCARYTSDNVKKIEQNVVFMRSA